MTQDKYPHVSYWCLMRVLIVAMEKFKSLPPDQGECLGFIQDLMSFLEKRKHELKPVSEEGFEMCSQRALLYLKMGDEDETNRSVTKNTVKLFLCAATLLEVCTQFPQFDDVLKHKWDYAKLKASEVAKVVKSGTTPDVKPSSPTHLSSKAKAALDTLPPLTEETDHDTTARAEDSIPPPPDDDVAPPPEEPIANVAPPSVTEQGQEGAVVVEALQQTAAESPVLPFPPSGSENHSDAIVAQPEPSENGVQHTHASDVTVPVPAPVGGEVGPDVRLPATLSSDLPQPLTAEGIIQMIRKARAAMGDGAHLFRREYVRGRSGLEWTGTDAGFSVMQFNVLAEGLCADPHVTPPFQNNLPSAFGCFNEVPNPREVLAFSNRKWRIVEEVLRYTPSIIAMQEVDHFGDFFEPVLRCVGYQGVYQPRQNSPCLPFGYYSDGVAIFWKEKEFESIKTVKRPRFLITQLRHLVTGRNVFVATTHLTAGANSKHETAREAQVTELLKVLEFLASNVENASVVLAADFNVSPHSPVKARSKAASSASSALSAATFDSVLTSSSTLLPSTPSLCVQAVGSWSSPPLDSAYGLEGGVWVIGRPYSVWKRRAGEDLKSLIDYIWHSVDLKCAEVLAAPSADQLPPHRLPCASHPSDHISLVARLVWPPQEDEPEVRWVSVDAVVCDDNDDDRYDADDGHGATTPHHHPPQTPTLPPTIIAVPTSAPPATIAASSTLVVNQAHHDPRSDANDDSDGEGEGVSRRVKVRHANLLSELRERISRRSSADDSSATTLQPSTATNAPQPLPERSGDVPSADEELQFPNHVRFESGDGAGLRVEEHGRGEEDDDEFAAEGGETLRLSQPVTYSPPKRPKSGSAVGSIRLDPQPQVDGVVWSQPWDEATAAVSAAVPAVALTQPLGEESEEVPWPAVLSPKTGVPMLNLQGPAFRFDQGALPTFTSLPPPLQLQPQPPQLLVTASSQPAATAEIDALSNIFSTEFVVDAYSLDSPHVIPSVRSSSLPTPAPHTARYSDTAETIELASDGDMNENDDDDVDNDTGVGNGNGNHGHQEEEEGEGEGEDDEVMEAAGVSLTQTQTHNVTHVHEHDEAAELDQALTAAEAEVVLDQRELPPPAQVVAVEAFNLDDDAGPVHAVVVDALVAQEPIEEQPTATTAVTAITQPAVHDTPTLLVTDEDDTVDLPSPPPNILDDTSDTPPAQPEDELDFLDLPTPPRNDDQDDDGGHQTHGNNNEDEDDKLPTPPSSPKSNNNDNSSSSHNNSSPAIVVLKPVVEKRPKHVIPPPPSAPTNFSDANRRVNDAKRFATLGVSALAFYDVQTALHNIIQAISLLESMESKEAMAILEAANKRT